MADYTEGSAPRAPVRAGALVNYAGAAVSLGLMIGVAVWGYKLVMRDVRGIPVVQAMDGPMRIAPTEPGGEIAAHEGLSVNAVAAMGGAANPEDAEMLVLAPQTTDLTEDDLDIQTTAEADEFQGNLGETAEAVPTETPVVAQIAPVAPVVQGETLTQEQILALADQLAAGSTPLAPLESEVKPVEMAVNGVSVDRIAEIVPSAVPGVAVSLRPQLRPTSLVVAAPVVNDAAAVSAAVEPASVTTTDFAAGTNLVQLGAFDSAEIAASEWTRLNGRFPDYLSGKDRVIQEAARGGRTFYRLRAAGFADQSDARRLCAALISENADCVPVVVR